MSANEIILKDRKFLSVTGVKDVNAFTEESVILTLETSSLVVRGETLHISKLDLESGEVDVDGKVNSLQYIKENQDKSFLKRLLRKWHYTKLFIRLSLCFHFCGVYLFT